VRFFKLALILSLALAITLSSAVRVPLIERFTNTSCGYCPPCGEMIDNLWDTHGEAISIVEVHTNWPGPSDPYYLAAPADNQARWNHYAITGVPAVTVDGKKLANWATTPTETSTRLAATSDLGMSIASTDSGLSGVHVTLDVEAPISGTNNRLFVTVVQDNNYYPSAPNGEVWAHHVLMKIFPTPDGQVVNLSTVGVQEIFVPITVAGTWRVEDCRVVAWVQNMSGAVTGYNVINSVSCLLHTPEFLFAFSPGNTSGVIWSDTSFYALEGGKIKNRGLSADEYVMTITKDLPAGWTAAFCAGMFCFPDSGAITLDPGDSADIAIDFYPGGPGTGIVELNIISVAGGQTASATYTLNHSPDILIVDDDAGANYESYYINTLDALGEHYAVHNRGSDEVTGAQLLQYDIVIWFTGGDYSEVTTASDRTAIGQYIDGGGKMFMTSQDLGWHSNETGNIAWFNSRFKANYIADDSGLRSVTGSAGSPFEGVSLNLYTGDGADFTPYPSTIAPIGGSTECFRYGATSNVAGVVYEGDYRLVYFAFPFEAINGQTARNNLMTQVLGFLREGTVVADEVARPDKSLIVSASPNPFNAAVSLEFELLNSAEVTLDVFDLSGRMVARLINGDLFAGKQRTIWDGRSSSNEELPSGVYLVRLKAGELTTTSKILLAK